MALRNQWLSASGLPPSVPYSFFRSRLEASRDADWRDVWPACLMGFFFVPLGVFLLLSTDPSITRRLMGGLVILVALIMIRGWNSDAGCESRMA